LPYGPSFSEGCYLSPQQCDEINQAINDLETHSDATCRYYGSQARDRYESPAYGFYDDLSYEGLAYTYMVIYPSTDEWGSADGNTFLGQGAWQNDDLRAAVVHEEVHHAGNDGPDHDTGLAVNAELQCG
jgi:hypothetical protein